MRIFTNESIWDAENQDWCEVYFIDGQRVSIEEYSEQLKVEESVADEDLEVNDDYQECQCDDCVEQRRLEQEEMCNLCENCDCGDGDDELTDWQKQIVDIVEDFAFKIEHEIETDGLCECGCTLRNMLADMFYQARQIGFGDGMECGIESVEEKTVNYHIDNLTVNSNDVGDLEEMFKKLPSFTMGRN